MAVLAIADQSTPSPSSNNMKPKAWSFRGLLTEIGQYLWRYGTATDVETDPVELLKHAYHALDNQEKAFEKEQEADERLITQLTEENKKLKVELVATKAKIPPWWKG